MRCKTCNRESEDSTHPYCRAHSFCAAAGGAQYHAAPCYICQTLFDRASDGDNPLDAIEAFEGLSKWIGGFRKNSRHREKGQDHFFEPLERDAFEQLHALHASHPPFRRRGASTPGPSISVSGFLCRHFVLLFLFLDEI